MCALQKPARHAACVAMRVLSGTCLYVRHSIFFSFFSSSSSGCNSLLAQLGLVDQSLLLSQLCNIVRTSVSFDRPSKKIVTPVHHVVLGREVAEGIECRILKEEVKKKTLDMLWNFQL